MTSTKAFALLAAAMQIVTEGLDETGGRWIIFLIVCVLSWVIILKSKMVNDWVHRQDSGNLLLAVRR